MDEVDRVKKATQDEFNSVPLSFPNNEKKREREKENSEPFVPEQNEGTTVNLFFYNFYEYI